MTALVTTREIGVNRTAQGFSSRHGGRASGHHHYEEGPWVKERGASYRPVRAGAAVVGGELGSSLYRLLDGED
jgi:hypothetical protein